MSDRDVSESVMKARLDGTFTRINEDGGVKTLKVSADHLPAQTGSRDLPRR